jgi:hypothetical protein
VGRNGETDKKIYVYSNDPSNPKFDLTLKGKIISEVMVNPDRLSFGALGKSQTGSRDLSVTFRDPEKVSVSSVNISGIGFSIEPGSVDSEGTTHYKIKFLGSDTAGTISGRLRINLKGSSIPYVDVPVQATIMSDIVYRQSLDFRQRGGKYLPQEVRFMTRAGIPVEILGVEDTAGLLETEILEREGHRSVIKAQVANPGEVPSNRGPYKMIVSTDHEEEPELEILYRIALPRTR